MDNCQIIAIRLFVTHSFLILLAAEYRTQSLEILEMYSNSKFERAPRGKCPLCIGLLLSRHLSYGFILWRRALRLWLEVRHVRASAHAHTSHGPEQIQLAH